MDIRWRIEKKGAVTAAAAVEDAISASPEPMPEELSAEARKQQFLVYLKKHMATAIAAALLTESAPVEGTDED